MSFIAKVVGHGGKHQGRLVLLDTREIKKSDIPFIPPGHCASFSHAGTPGHSTAFILAVVTDKVLKKLKRITSSQEGAPVQETLVVTNISRN